MASYNTVRTLRFIPNQYKKYQKISYEIFLRYLGTDRLLLPGGAVVLEGGGGYNFKTSPFLGGKFFSGKKHEGVKFYDTATAV